mmetsp:Transcript_8704/g.20716  ORF Transcript_8704/g.20716 Transcript_8704/m.20716 type:complete len:138 (-) Transcript_8704:122-535(-)
MQLKMIKLAMKAARAAESRHTVKTMGAYHPWNIWPWGLRAVPPPMQLQSLHRGILSPKFFRGPVDGAVGLVVPAASVVVHGASNRQMASCAGAASAHLPPLPSSLKTLASALQHAVDYPASLGASINRVATKVLDLH